MNVKMITKIGIENIIVLPMQGKERKHMVGILPNGRPMEARLSYQDISS
jgi:hypothetical protein